MEDRKKDHISLAFETRTSAIEKDTRFVYEPMMTPHPNKDVPGQDVGGKKMQVPIWISSMTGGTEKANKINHNLARVAGEFGMGMGLGSCNILLKNENYLPDFDLRDVIGPDFPFYANMGIAQIEQLLELDKVKEITDLISLLKADGLVIHVNPIQEWLQPEGDYITRPPIETIKEFLSQVNYNIIVKEVGQGIGKQSLKSLLELPLTAVEFAAFGGTNFAKVELMRNKNANAALLDPLSFIGQTAEEMTQAVNAIIAEETNQIKTDRLIISGGLKTFLDGYYFINKSRIPAVYGMASTFLKYAQEDYHQLKNFAKSQVEGLKMAYSYLNVI
jgi:isopentenyl-diphosphate delta-isomerase